MIGGRPRMRSMRIAAAVTTAVALLLSSTTPASASKPAFAPHCGKECRQKNLPFSGVFADPMTPAKRTDLASIRRSASMQAQAGAEWVRISVSWTALQPNPDGFDPVQLAAYDAQV